VVAGTWVQFPHPDLSILLYYLRIVTAIAVAGSDNTFHDV
jgi:hypothetical protein